MPADVYPRRLSELSEVFEKQIFFLCGVLKSGTTWLERLLDVHPEIVCKGEAHFASNFVRPLAELVNTYNQEVSTKGAAIVHLKEYGGATDVLEYNDDDIAFLSIAAIGSMFTKWSTPDTRIIGDKTPRNLEDMHLLSQLFPSAKFVHLIRDGRDVAVSLWHFNLNTNISATIQQWGTFENFSHEFAEIWANRVSAGRELGQSLGNRYHEVRYEDLLECADTTLANVYSFLGAADTRELVGENLKACSFKSLSGGRERGTEDASSFFRKGVANDWKNHFSAPEREKFQAIAGDTLAACGYSLE